MVYPLVAHVAILLDQVIWAAGYLLVITYFNSLNFLFRHKIIRFIVPLMLFIVVVYSFFYTHIENWVIYLPPVLTPAWLAFVFIGSLFKKQAFITLLAEKIEGKSLEQQHLNYTRRLTAIWGVVFILMICEAIILAFWASFEMWSWWVHIGNYLIIVVLFFGEILIRPLFVKYKDNPANNFRELLQTNWYESKDK